MSKRLSIVADQQIAYAREAFSQFGEVQLVDGRSINTAVVKNADVLLVRSVTRINESLLKNSSVRFIGSATSGVDHVDLEYLKHASIEFRYAPGSNARSVAEYVLSGLFVIAELKGFSVSDKTVGIIGHGQVGSRVSHFLQSLDVNVLLNDPPLALQDSDNSYTELDEIVKADIITLHVPLTADGGYPTREMVNDPFLKKVNPDAILVNTSRGEVIDESALLNFKKNSNATLFLDVWCNEPIINIDLLQETLIATPHIAGYSLDGKLRATQMLAEELSQFISGDKDSVNIYQPELDMTSFEINEHHVQQAVMQSYNIKEDATGLRQLFSLEKAEYGSCFDGLRKNYPVRREFKSRIIKSQNMSDETEKQLSRLGFGVDRI